MESSCVRQTSIPGTSPLFGDFLYDFDRVKRFYSYNFQDSTAFAQAASQLDYPDERRKALVDALRELNPDSKALEKLAQPGTVAVVTGQQVGLFSGPAYTIYKALTAVRIARQLSENGIPAVPVFWLATEDHDLAEVSYTWVFNGSGNPAKVSFFPPVNNGVPVGGVRLSEPPIDELRAALEGLPFADEVVAEVRSAYAPGTPLGTSFRVFLQKLLRGMDLIFLDPLSPKVREVAGPFLARAVEAVPDLLPLLRERNKELVESGYHAQVNVDEDTSLVFLLNDKRVPLRWRDGLFHARDAAFSAADLAGQQTAISPNALLRPVMQDYLLPTVCYVGGPAEIAYMAQAEVLYRNLLGRMPVIYPRNSFTLLDARSAKIMDRYDLRVAELLQHQDQVKTQIGRKLISPDLLEQFASLQRTVDQSTTRLQAGLRSFDPTLESAAQKSLAKIHYQIQKLERKTANERLRREERGTRDAEYLFHAVYPERHLQERFYSMLPFLAKAGLDLPERLLEQTQLACPDHMVRSY
jgi:bacillithiol synthase